MATIVMPEIGNQGLTLLNGGINASVTTVNVDSAAALTLDNSTTDAYITVIDPTTFGKNPFSTPETQEVMRVTGVSTNALTVTRGVDGTSGTEFADNSYVMLRNNAATLQRVYDALTDGNDTLDVAGFSGALQLLGNLNFYNSGTSAQINWGSATDASLAQLSVHETTADINFSTLRSGADLIFRADNFVTNLTLNGTGSSIKATFVNDVEVGGDLTLGASGVNKVWSKWVSCVDMIPSTTIPPGAIVNQVMASDDVHVAMMPFDQSAIEAASFVIMLPDDYDGSELDFSIYWTGLSGTATNSVIWLINASVFGNDETMTATNAATTISDAYIAAKDLHIVTGSITPTGASTGSLLTAYVRRNGTSGSDTFDADSQLIGVRISYT